MSQAEQIIDELRAILKVPDGRSIIEVATERMIEISNLNATVGGGDTAISQLEQENAALQREVCLLHDVTIILRNCLKGHEHLSAWCSKGLRDAESVMNHVARINEGERL